MFEKVNPAHPDKVADRIAGALVDLAYTKEEDPKIAVEVLVGHGVCHIIAETSVYIFDDEADPDLYKADCRIIAFEGNWMKIEAETKKGRIEKLIPVSSVLSMELVREDA